MKSADIFEWIIIVGAISIVLLIFYWSLCSIAKLSDERSERYWKENYKDDEEQQDTIESAQAAVDT